MGDPKRQRKKYETPRYPWSAAVLDADLRLLGEYGLRNKRELRRHRFMLSKYRALARLLLGRPADERAKLEQELLGKLTSLKIVMAGATLDDVLDLTVNAVLERRLQTLVFKLGKAKTPQQARQLITHGHIAVKGRRVTSPSYLVKRTEEERIDYAETSPFKHDDSEVAAVTYTASSEG
jgi:small subunit ribosomal protein S4